VFPQTRGVRPPDLPQRRRHGAALARLAAADAHLHRLVAAVQRLAGPASLLREPELASRVNALMAATG